MELLPLGPVVIIDTPGLDDTGELGELRIQKAYQILNKTDIAVLVIDSVSGMTDVDAGILDRILKKEIPYVVVLNKSDLAPGSNTDFTGCMPAVPSDKVIAVSTVTGENIHELKELIARQAPVENERRIVYGMIKPSDFVVLVVPIDKSAPKGRLILPQQQTIRDVLESGAVSIVTRETELEETMEKLGHPPALVITDSQAFEKVAAMVPLDIPLTSFSILFARYKGNLETVVNGAKALDTLEEEIQS